MFLHEWLTKNEITARDFAAKIGKHESIMSRILSGQQWPSYTMARQVFDATGGEVGFMDWMKPVRKRSRKTA